MLDFDREAIEKARQAVQDAHSALLGAREGLRGAIRQARAHGATWAEVAELFGISRQAAQVRFR